jgi:hypothetical protein
MLVGGGITSKAGGLRGGLLLRFLGGSSFLLRFLGGSSFLLRFLGGSSLLSLPSHVSPQRDSCGNNGHKRMMTV